MVDLPLAVASHYWNADNGDSDCFSGKGHTNQVSSMAVNENDELVSCGMDDTLRFTNLKKNEYRSASLCASAVLLSCCAWLVTWGGWHCLKSCVIRVLEGQSPVGFLFFFLHRWSWLAQTPVVFTGDFLFLGILSRNHEKRSRNYEIVMMRLFVPSLILWTAYCLKLRTYRSLIGIAPSLPTDWKGFRRYMYFYFISWLRDIFS